MCFIIPPARKIQLTERHLFPFYKFKLLLLSPWDPHWVFESKGPPIDQGDNLLFVVTDSRPTTGCDHMFMF